MGKNKILIIEDDVLVRQSIANRLQDTGDFQVTGMTLKEKNTADAILSLKPDMVLLNVEHMESRGFDKLERLLREFPGLPVVVISPRTEEGGKAVIKALQMGAVDFITKPRPGVSLLFAGHHLSKRVVPIVNTAVHSNDNRDMLALEIASYGRMSHPQQEFEQMGLETKKEPVDKPARLLVIGACTGGPQELSSLAAELPAGLDIPIVVAQHLPKRFAKSFAEILNEQSRIEVREAYDGAELVPGTIWIASGGYHTEVHNEGNKMKLRTHRGPREMEARPSINVLFRSAALQYGPEALGIILSGHGSDGVGGAKAIKLAGGAILAQNPKLSVAPEMPLKVIRSGIADQFFPVYELAHQIVSRVSAADKRFGRQAYNKRSGPYRAQQIRLNGV